MALVYLGWTLLLDKFFLGCGIVCLNGLRGHLCSTLVSMMCMNVDSLMCHDVEHTEFCLLMICTMVGMDPLFGGCRQCCRPSYWASTTRPICNQESLFNELYLKSPCTNMRKERTIEREDAQSILLLGSPEVTVINEEWSPYQFPVFILRPTCHIN